MRGLLAGLCLALVAACKQGSDAGSHPAPSASAPAARAPGALDGEKVSVVELRDRRSTKGKEHDVAFRLVREGSSFSWTAKGTVTGSVGERVPDPAQMLKRPYQTPCACGIDVRCSCESSPEGDEIVSKTGRVAVDKVLPVLTLLAGKRTAPPPALDGGAGWGGEHTAHLVAFSKGSAAEFHASRFAGAWIVNGAPIALGDGTDGGPPDVDAAWDALLAALDLPNWYKELNPPPPADLPSDFADLPKAQTLEIYDGWNGLGTTHGMVARLERAGAGFKMIAKYGPAHDGMQESILDPYDPKGTQHYVLCKCALDVLCQCDRDAKVVKGTVPAAPVEAFLAEIARHGVDRSPVPSRGHWTDDYPRGHTIVWTKAGATPIHLSFLDQQRQWRANGLELSPDPSPPDADATSGQHAIINQAYQAMLGAIGLPGWIKALGARHRR